jgi:AcrR family transcriptional regulator
MVAEKKSKTITRDALLEAANQIVMAQGSEALTLEAVARKAGVSKGGLLYHFPNKEALIVGMLEQLIDMFETGLQQELEQDNSPEPGRWLRAYIRTSVIGDEQQIPVFASLMAAVAVNPELLKPVQARFDQWQAKAGASGIDPTIANIILLALDGLWFNRILGAAPSERTRQEVIEALLEMAKKPG